MDVSHCCCSVCFALPLLVHNTPATEAVKLLAQMPITAVATLPALCALLLLSEDTLDCK